MIATSKRNILLFAAASLMACTAAPDRDADDISPTPIHHLRAKVRTVIPALVVGAVALSDNIKSNREEKDTTVPLPAVEEPVVITSFESLQEILSPPVEKFLVDASEDTVITCSEGTKLYLPATIFGTTDSVHIAVEEYYSRTDFMFNNLSTVSDGRILKSGGTVKITATAADGEELQVQEGESFTVLFPKTDDPNMQLFYGEPNEDGIMNWKPAEEQQPELKMEIDQKAWLMDISRPWLLLDPVITWYFTDKNAEPRDLIEYFNEEFNQVEDMPSYYNYTTKEDAQKRNIKDLRYVVNYNEDGKADHVQLDGAYSYAGTALDISIQNFIYDMPAIKIKRGEHSQILKFYTLTRIDEAKYKKDFEKKYDRYKSKVIDEMPQAELDYFLLSSTETGWLNCDEFVNIPGALTRPEIVTNIPRGTQYFMLFDDINTTICPEKYTATGCIFPGVPVGQQVKLVAITFVNNQPFMALQRIAIPNGPIELNNFSPFTMDELKEALE